MLSSEDCDDRAKSDDRAKREEVLRPVGWT